MFCSLSVLIWSKLISMKIFVLQDQLLLEREAQSGFNDYFFLHVRLD